MDDMKRGDDAADHAPRPDRDARQRGQHAAKDDNGDRQDAPNYRDKTDKGQAIEREDVSSANDE